MPRLHQLTALLALLAVAPACDVEVLDPELESSTAENIGELMMLRSAALSWRSKTINSFTVMLENSGDALPKRPPRLMRSADRLAAP